MVDFSRNFRYISQFTIYVVPIYVFCKLLVKRLRMTFLLLVFISVPLSSCFWTLVGAIVNKLEFNLMSLIFHSFVWVLLRSFHAISLYFVCAIYSFSDTISFLMAASVPVVFPYQSNCHKLHLSKSLNHDFYLHIFKWNCWSKMRSLFFSDRRGWQVDQRGFAKWREA